MRHGRVVMVAVSAALAFGGVVAAAPPAVSATPAWKIMTSPNPIGSTATVLTDVSCASASSCFAVGFYARAPKLTKLAGVIERWNGTKWSIIPSGASVATYFISVSCPSAVSCFAVGGDGEIGTAAIQHWDGTRWSSVALPDPAGIGGLRAGSLDAVSCLSPTSCTAFGSGTELIFMHWDGSSWTAQPGVTPTNPDPTNDRLVVRLPAVACASANSCFAIGSYDIVKLSDFSFVRHTLAEHWDGTSWTFVTIPSSTATEPDSLNDIACPAANSCFIVGARSNGTPLVEHWNGTKWALTANAKKGIFGLLESVSCPTAKSCVATGYSVSNAHDLVDRFDGKAWSITTSPNPKGTTTDHVGGVSCPKTTICFSAGSAATDKPPSTGSWFPRYKSLIKRYA